MIFQFPPIYNLLNSREKKAVKSVVMSIYELNKTSSLFWGGSTTIRNLREKYADIDFWLVLEEKGKVKEKLYSRFAQLEGIIFVNDGGHFAWLGDLLSLFFHPHFTLTIDVGICDFNDLPMANPGPKPYFIWGESSRIRQLLRPQKYEILPEQRVKNIVVSLLKIRKCFLRGHLWNAIEYLSRARRELSGLFLINAEPKDIYYIRPERDIEDYLSNEDLGLLASTLPSYSPLDVAKKCSMILHECFEYTRKAKIGNPIGAELDNLQIWFREYVENNERG